MNHTSQASSLPPPPSEMESKFYYAGLPSSPTLVARISTTDTPWEAPTGPEAYTRRKELSGVGNHPIRDAWEEGGLGVKVYTLLDAMNVKWSSIDIVRIGYSEESFAPVVLWIGVNPASLSGVDGVVVVHKCREILEENCINDVDVEIRETIRWPTY